MEGTHKKGYFKLKDLKTLFVFPGFKRQDILDG